MPCMCGDSECASCGTAQGTKTTSHETGPWVLLYEREEIRKLDDYGAVQDEIDKARENGCCLDVYNLKTLFERADAFHDLLAALLAVSDWQSDAGPLAGKTPYELAEYCRAIVAKAGGAR